ncbi:mechanosensitive ion channel domain-containing protein [Thioalkalivibrio sp. AKL6]|uniref:mechanosensitive ion channel domain-containing protein n=1 Tax=Thioalkalivibrio sp. AKL6 TaxID=1158154 RepID=UPI0003655C73|nr:mechanosensitive ion channel domain-containing protein [Thioalkalivibrio sp. AKL6]
MNGNHVSGKRRGFGRRAIHALALLLWITSGGPHAWAEEAPSPDTPEAVTPAEVDALETDLAAFRDRLPELLDAVDTQEAEAWLAASPLAELEQRSADEERAEEERALWDEAREVEQAGVERVQGAIDRAATARALPERLDELEQALEGVGAFPRGLGEEVSIRRLEEELGRLGRDRERLETELEDQRVRLSQLEEQAEVRAETLERLRQERQELEDAPRPLAEGGEWEDAREAVQQARVRRADAALLAARMDANTLPPRMQALRLLVRGLELELRWQRVLQGRLERRLTELSSEELQELRGALRSLLEREPEAQRHYESEIEELHATFDHIAEAQARIRTLQRERDRLLRVERELEQSLGHVHERLEISGLTEALGGVFLEEQRRLRDLDQVRFQLRDLERELARSQLRTISLRERLAAIPDAREMEWEAPVRSTLRDLRRQALNVELHTEEARTEQLRQTDLRLRSVLELVEELDRTLSEALLWWPSHSPVGGEWLERLPAASRALLDPDAWADLRETFLRETLHRPLVIGFLLLVTGLLYLAGRNIHRHLERLAEATQHRYTDRIGVTLRALGWSVLRALPVPFLLLSVAFQLHAVPETGFGVEVLSRTLITVSVWWLAGHLLLLFIGRNGVGTTHFGWSEPLITRLHQHLHWFLPLQTFLFLLVALTFGHPSDAVFDLYGRLALLAVIVNFGVLAWLLLAPNHATGEPLMDERRRLLLRGVVVIGMLGLVTLALAGYLYTVAELLRHLIGTVVVLIAVGLGYGLAARWLLLGETRLALLRIRERREQEETTEGASGGEAGVDVPEPRLSMEDVNAQSRTLLRVAALGGTLVGLLWVWSDILPALAWLDGITLWSRTIEIGESEITTSVSLQDLLLATFLGVLFVLAARNLPGLVEILLSRSTKMDAPGRYTFTVLLRYLMAVVAVIVVFSLLGLRWSEIQWLVAALTVGLGFGLQEVVANFVAGLIVLLERPVRVGDTITVGEYSGTVSKIRGRATTIVDWDNREIVVPNKTFISDHLINWTLSDTTTRLVIPVGVSYASDVDLVRETLLEVAHDDPHVLEDPESVVYFLRFGDNALNFELRVFVCQMADRLVTLSGLHTAIIKRFREQGIEIALPQMDVHLHDDETRRRRAVPPAAGPDEPGNPMDR